MINFEEGRVSTILLSTISGHSGKLFFLYGLSPSHRKMLKIAREAETAEILKSSTRFKNVGNFNPRKPSTWNAMSFGSKPGWSLRLRSR